MFWEGGGARSIFGSITKCTFKTFEFSTGTPVPPLDPHMNQITYLCRENTIININSYNIHVINVVKLTDYDKFSEPVVIKTRTIFVYFKLLALKLGAVFPFT